jgi:hypothetical protein
VVLDAFSRRIVGWSMATTLHLQGVLDALNMALWQRRPSGVIHHSDHGSQYTSIEFGKRCREAGVRPSMGSVGDAYDNAMAEASSPRSNASCSIGVASKPKPKPASPSSNSSRASTTRAGGTHRSDICHPSSSSANLPRRPWIPLHASLPSCSRLSRSGLENVTPIFNSSICQVIDRQ